MEYLMGKAGNGNKIHVVSVFTRPSDGAVFHSIFCGAQQFNGSGNGSLNRVQDLDVSKITCKRCLKHYQGLIAVEANKELYKLLGIETDK